MTRVPNCTPQVYLFKNCFAATISRQGCFKLTPNQPVAACFITAATEPIRIHAAWVLLWLGFLHDTGIVIARTQKKIFSGILFRQNLRLTLSGRRMERLVDLRANFLPPWMQLMALLMSLTQCSLSSTCDAWKKWSCFFSVVILKTS